MELNTEELVELLVEYYAHGYNDALNVLQACPVDKEAMKSKAMKLIRSEYESNTN